MSLSRELQLHINQLKEIRSILNAMKNMALMETHKLQRFKILQGQAVANIESAAMDFLAFYPGLTACNDSAAQFCILLGAERGFCGDFNKSLIDASTQQTYTGVIAIGSRLEDSCLNVIATLEGANVAEEVPAIINHLVDTISSLSKGDPALQLSIAYHDNTNQISQRQLLPPFLLQAQKMIPHGTPPVLNLAPDDFFIDLVDHYLFSVLHEIFYLSLLAENYSRLQHLEGAVKHLDDQTIKLQRKSQICRQEEITEEIEVILLNADYVAYRNPS